MGVFSPITVYFSFKLINLFQISVILESFRITLSKFEFEKFKEFLPISLLIKKTLKLETWKAKWLNYIDK